MILLYACIALVLAPHFARRILDDFTRGDHLDPDGFDYFSACAFGLIAALLWPFVVVGFAVYYFAFIRGPVSEDVDR